MPRSRRTLLASLAGGFGVVGSIGVHLADRPTDPPSDVESFQYDVANTGTTAATTGPGPEVTERWRAAVWGTEHSSPVVVDDVAYIGRRSDGFEGGDIVALETTTGTERWAFTVDIRDAGDVAYVNVRNTPVVADGVVSAQTHAGDLYTLEAV